ncbi:Armadillo-type fold [Sesbania bispinosa]|nr:Armadillo-type fold [Sesbania bispinosa]
MDQGCTPGSDSKPDIEQYRNKPLNFQSLGFGLLGCIMVEKLLQLKAFVFPLLVKKLLDSTGVFSIYLATCEIDEKTSVKKSEISQDLLARAHETGAIRCLASITDSSVTTEVFVSLLKRFQLVDCEGDAEILTNSSRVLDNEPSDEKGYSQRITSVKEYSLHRVNFLGTQATNESVHHEAYNTLSKILEEHPCFFNPRYMELIDLLLGLKPPTSVASLRSRFACFHMLMGNDEARKEAYDLLLNVSSSLRDLSCVGPTEPYHKLVSMIMGYLSGSSPHIKSGAVSALSVLVYKDTNLCLSISDLVPSLLSLLRTKDVEIIKAVLGFVKVMVSCLQAKELQNILSDVITEILPWSSVSRHHFRSKVTVIFEILIRKCGSAAVKRVTPDKHKGFLKTVLENRHGKSSEAVSNDAENMPDDSSAKGVAKRNRYSNDKSSNVRSAGGKKGKKSRYQSFTEGGKRKGVNAEKEADLFVQISFSLCNCTYKLGDNKERI